MSDLTKIKEALSRAVERKNKAADSAHRKEIMDAVGKDIVNILTPVFREMVSQSASDRKSLIDELKEIIKEIKFELPEIVIPPIDVPEVYVPDFPEIPEPRVNVNVPPIKIPDVIMPKEMEVRGWVGLMGVSLDNPLPVQLRDKDGKPVNLLENLTTVIGSSGGGGFKVNKISDIANSAWGNLLTGDGRLKTESASGSSGLTDSELRASSVPVQQVSGSTWSVSVNDAFRTTVASSLINSDDRLRVSLETGGSGLTDAELRATAVPVSQLSGASWTVNVVDVFATTAASTVVNPDNRVKVESVGTQVVSATDLDIRDLVDATDSVRVYQLSGASWSVTANANSGVDIGDVDVTSIVPGTGASNLGKAEDAAHASGDTGVLALSVRNSLNTTFAVDGDYQPIATDGIGRVITRPVQVRGLLQTAYVSLTTGTETTLLAGAAGVYFDLVYVMGTNNSDAAVTVDLRSATGGGIITSIRVPANGTAGVSLSAPIPQDIAADTWTADLPDITGSTITISALFSREV